MRRFFEAYPTVEFGQSATGQIDNNEKTVSPATRLPEDARRCFYMVGFTHHVLLLQKCPDVSERFFYMRQAARNQWFVETLHYHIVSNFYKHLLANYGKDIAPCLKISLPRLDGKDICRISISPAPRAVFVKDGADEQFFIRTGNSKRRLSMSETVKYCKRRWRS